VYERGYEITVQEDAGAKWFWMVKSTSTISEYPEIIDCGTVGGRKRAKIQAVACVNRQKKSRLRTSLTDQDLDDMLALEI
jgi:hypothetical protein